MSYVLIDNEKVAKNQYFAQKGSNKSLNGKEHHFIVSRESSPYPQTNYKKKCNIESMELDLSLYFRTYQILLRHNFLKF